MSPPVQWRIGFTIHEARNLKTKGGAPIDPLVVVKCPNREFTTQIKRGKAGVVSWDETHLWTDIQLKPRQLETTFIVFELQAANAFWRNDVVGSCSLQLSVVHNRKTHQLRKALPLQLLNEPEVQGYLRVSCYVLGPNDSPPSGDAQTDDEDVGGAPDDLREAAIDVNGVNPRETGKPYHIYISVHRVEDLFPGAKTERDPFFTVNFAGSKLRSTQARGTCSHTFNECFRLPAATPLHEDTLTLSLWDWNMIGKDELLACGRLSFAELRAKPWFQRWYYFYGFDTREVSSLASFVSESDAPPPANQYLGRVLLSARTERLEGFTKLLPAQMVAAKPLEDLVTVPVSVVADVYTVTGLPKGFSQICVELSLGPISAKSKWAKADFDENQTAYAFEQEEGRIETLTLAMPRRENQRWDLILSVYGKRSGGGSEVRVAFNRFPLKSLPGYVQGSPRAPSWAPLFLMPAAGGSPAHSPAVLVLINKTDAEFVVRDKRKFMSESNYQLRCYCIAARNLPRVGMSPPNAAVRVSVAGASAISSVCKRSCFPVWEDCVQLNCRLPTDPTVGVSALAPVTLTVTDCRKTLCFFLAKTSCTYDRLRDRPIPGEPVAKLQPRWVKLRGRGSKDAAILIALELTKAANAARVPFADPRALLRKCEVTVSLYGLRNLILPKKEGGFLEWLLAYQQDPKANAIRAPIVVAAMASYGAQGEKKAELVFTRPKHREEGKAKDSAGFWRCGAMSSCDYFASRTVPMYLPDAAVFDPYLTLSVYDKKVKAKNFVGDAAVRLLPVLPWISDYATAEAETEALLEFNERVDFNKLAKVAESVKAAVESRHKGFANLGLCLLKEADEQFVKEVSSDTKGHQSRVKSKWITSVGEPEFLLETYEAFEAEGYHLYPLSTNLLYMNVFTPANLVLGSHGKFAVEGERTKTSKDSAEVQPHVAGEFEQFYDDNDWPAIPLLRKVSGKTYADTGAVKCATTVDYQSNSRCSVRRELVPLLKDDAKFRKAYRDSSVVPAALRLRVYVIRGIGLSHSGGASSDVHPYLSFALGSKTENFRGNAKESKSSPDFCYLYESDVCLPAQSRLEISVYSKGSGLIANDPLIGMTVVDLEERWLSPIWQQLMQKVKVPVELRELRQPGVPNASFGTLQLWVEMLTPERALEVPRVALRESPPIALEIRVVVWGCRALSFKHLKKDYIDARVQVSLDCPTSGGSQPLTQCTDVHYFSRNGNAIFNWRCVFSQIKLPVSTCVLQLAAFDYRTLGPAVFVGEVNLELKTYLDKVAQDLSSREYDAELRLINRKLKTAAAPGFVQVTVQIIPQQDGNGKPVGLGRDSPNREPHLATPLDGRKWEDFIKASGLRKDFSSFLQKLRVALLLLLFFVLFILAFVYPALFYQ